MIEPRAIWTSDRSLDLTLPQGESAGESARRAAALARVLRRADLPWLVDAAGCEDLVGVIIDPRAQGAAGAGRELEILAAQVRSVQLEEAQREHILPVCYGSGHGEDLERAAQILGFSSQSVIKMHSSAIYQVVSVGFSPGFAYLAGLPAELQLPRLEKPRPRVPAGSVAMAEDRTAVYPHATAGGWLLIGRCSTRLFNPHSDHPALLRVGDRVRFKPVEADTVECIR